MRNSIGPISLENSALMTSVALQLMWWEVTFVFNLHKIFPPPALQTPLFMGLFAVCKPQVEFVSFPFWPILVSSLFLSGSIISSDRKKRTYFILVHLPVFVRWFYVWVLYNFPVIFIKWHLLDICVCLYLLPVPQNKRICCSISLQDVYVGHAYITTILSLVLMLWCCCCRLGLFGILK